MPVLSLTLDRAADLAIENSHRLAAQREATSAAREAAASANTKRFPQIGLEGQSRFISKIGKITLPTGQEMQVGEHYSWSVGPVLEWTAWDAGAIAKGAKSMRLTAEAEHFSTETVKRDALFSSRMGYFSAQLALEQLRLVAESLSVARAQYHDVSERFSAGTSSRLDFVTAHQEVLDRERDYEDAQAELAAQVRNLIAIVGLDQMEVPTVPTGKGLTHTLAAAPVKPNMLVDFDQIAITLPKMRSKAKGKVVIAKHPEVLSTEKQMEAARMAYDAARANHWPKLTVQGKSTYEYPNFAQAERIQQNTLSFGLSMPILDWGMISKDARSHLHTSLAAAEQIKETEIELARELGEARDKIVILDHACVTSQAAAKDAVEAASLVYQAYLAGEVIFLEVQRANLRVLQEKVGAARTEVQLLGQLARLERLITEAGEATP